MDNASKQIDEIEALSAIYGDEWKAESEGARQFRFSFNESGRDVTIIFHLPENYPSEAPPSFEMSAPSLTRSQKASIHEALNDVYMENLGETVLFQWIEKVREILQNLPNDSIPPEEEATLVVQEERICVPCPEIVHGEVIEDRRSHFQGHVAKILSPKDVEAVLWNLKCERKIASATHNILAWKCGVHQDYDDDGEKAAGSRLLRLLDLLNLDNIVVVVTRWYGGIHLGSDRFRHINNAARQTLVRAGVIPR